MKNRSLVVMDETCQSVDGKITKVARAEQTCAHQGKNVRRDCHKTMLVQPPMCTVSFVPYSRQVGEDCFQSTFSLSR